VRRADAGEARRFVLGASSRRRSRTTLGLTSERIGMINRGVLIVRPRQPFIDWAARLDDSGVVPDVDGEQTVYLIPDLDGDDDVENILERVYAEVFERELWGWHTDESAWPAKRTLKVFREWFAIELHSVVEDLCDYEIIDEDRD